MVHLIFEGAELSAKSYLLSLVYPVLEKRDNTNPNVLDGCYWINSDIGIFGTEVGPKIVEKYVEMAELLQNKNILIEKLHISDIVYGKMYNRANVIASEAKQSRGEIVNRSGSPRSLTLPRDDMYFDVERRLKAMNFKIVLTTFREDEALIAKRLEERLKQYPHYGRIAKPVSFYIQQQELYKSAVKASSLPYLEVDMSDLDPTNAQKIIEWTETV